MSEIQNPKRYDLEERTLKFLKYVIVLCKKLPKNTVNIELSKQEFEALGRNVKFDDKKQIDQYADSKFLNKDKE